MKTIRCPSCGEQALALRAGPNRFVTHRRVQVEVPHDFALPECAACGARPISARVAEQLDPLLEAAYQVRLQALVDADLERLAERRPLYEWEHLLGLSKGWLSKVREARAPGPQLVALVRLLANDANRERELRELWAAPGPMRVVTGRETLVATQAPPPAPPRVRLQLVDSGRFLQKVAA